MNATPFASVTPPYGEDGVVIPLHLAGRLLTATRSPVPVLNGAGLRLAIDGPL